MAAFPAQESNSGSGVKSGHYRTCRSSFLHSSPLSSFFSGAGAGGRAGADVSSRGVRVVAARNPGGRRLMPAPRLAGAEKGPRYVGFLDLASEIVGGTSQAEKGRKLPAIAVAGAEVADEEVTGAEEEAGAEVTGARKVGAGAGRVISAGTKRAIERTVEGAAAPGAP
jgi:hypothetical protein